MPTDVGCTDGRRNGDESDVSVLLLSTHSFLASHVCFLTDSSQNTKQATVSFFGSFSQRLASRLFQIDCGGTCPACNAGDKCNDWSDCSSDTCDGASGICLTRAPTAQPTDAPTLQPTVTPCEWLDVPPPPQLSVARFSSTGGQVRERYYLRWYLRLASFCFVLLRFASFYFVLFRFASFYVY
jgi:hypothetical protein